MGDKFSGGLDNLTASAVNDGLLKAGAETFVAIGDAVAKGAGAAFNAGKNAVVNGVELNVGEGFLATLGAGFNWHKGNDVAATTEIAAPVTEPTVQPTIQQASLGVNGAEHADFNSIVVPAMNRAQPKADPSQLMSA